MKFNIKQWQDKHLITEAKSLKKEIDFKSDDAFKKYNSKHKMRATTKVNIAGKDTTAGEAGGKEKKATSTPKTQAPIKFGDSVGKTSSGKDIKVSKNNKQFAEDTKDYTLEDHQEALKVLEDRYQYHRDEHEKIKPKWDKNSVRTDSGASKKEIEAQRKSYFAIEPSRHEDAIERLSNSNLHQFKETNREANKLRSSIKRRKEDFLNFGGTDKQEAKIEADETKLKMMDKQADKLLDKYSDEQDNKKTESVASRSTRIQESKIYRTIQELRALEKSI